MHCAPNRPYSMVCTCTQFHEEVLKLSGIYSSSSFKERGKNTYLDLFTRSI